MLKGLILFFTTFNLFAVEIDLNRYMGTWYEIARYNNFYQRSCSSTKVSYTLEGETIFVENTCRKKNDPSQLKIAYGRGKVTDKETNSKLEVSFIPFFNRFGLFAGPYWILHVDPDYSMALVGHPEEKYFWILARTPEISQWNYLRALKIANDNGYSILKIRKSAPWIEID
jgi:apolipoprotein D and lipocalin family protein